MPGKEGEKKPVNTEILRAIGEAVASVAYGTVSIKIHDSRITQIEITEKKRFDDLCDVEKGGGI